MRRALIPVLAVTGVVIGHTVAYAVAWPDAPQHTSVLQSTGHAYWQAAVAAALLAGVLAAGSHVAHAVRRMEELSLPRAGLRLALLQMAIFTMMESSERVAIDQPLTTLFDHHVLLIGLVAQAAVAVVLVQVLRLLGRVALAFTERASSGPSTVEPASISWTVPLVLRGACVGRPCGSRAPPLVA